MLSYHALPSADWESLPADASYAPASLEREGFIHTTIGPAGLARVLNALYRDDPRPYVALVINLDLVTERWDTTHIHSLDVDVPHIHGPLNRDAVVGVVPVRRDDHGRFLPPGT